MAYETVPEPFGPVYPDLGAGVAKFRRLATKAGSIRDMAKAERHAYADAIEKAIRAKHRTLHMRPTPAVNGGWYSPPSVARLLRYQNPPRGMAGEPDWDRNAHNQWDERSQAVYAATMEAKRALSPRP